MRRIVTISDNTVFAGSLNLPLCLIVVKTKSGEIVGFVHQSSFDGHYNVITSTSACAFNQNFKTITDLIKQIEAKDWECYVK